jgi:hypothetical protein
MKKENIKDAIKPAITKEKLIELTELHVSRDGMGYSESIIQICEDNDLDPIDVAKLVNGSLKEKVRAEAERNNIFYRPNSLY